MIILQIAFNIFLLTVEPVICVLWARSIFKVLLFVIIIFCLVLHRFSFGYVKIAMNLHGSILSVWISNLFYGNKTTI